MGFPMIDQPTTDISRYFYIASKFIENGINSGGEFFGFCVRIWVSSIIYISLWLSFFLSPKQVRSLCTVWWACPVRRPACWHTSWSPARWPPPRRSAPSECIGTFARTRASSSSWPIWTMSWSVTGCTIDSSVANASGRNNADYINLNVWG